MARSGVIGTLLILAALVLAACSGDDATSSGEPAPTEPSATEATPAPTEPTSTEPTESSGPPTSAAEALHVIIECTPGTGPDFGGLTQTSADYDGQALRCAVFDDGVLDGGSFVAADLTGASFVGASIRQARFDRAVLVGADLSGATLGQVRFSGSDLRGAVLEGADLSGIRWDETVCPDGIDSETAGGSCEGHLTPIPVVVEASDPAQVLAPLQFTPLCTPDSGDDLSGQVLRQPDFRRADLRCARFTEAELVGADFTEADASAADFAGATLEEPMFESTSLFGTSFAGATIRRGQFRNANLIGADLTGLVLQDARWVNTICPNGVNSDQAGGTCLGSRNALDLPAAEFAEITDADITVRQGSGLTTYTIASDVLFDFDSDQLTASAEAKVRLVMASIAERFTPDDQIQIWGHADAIGDPAYNLELSQRRADAVAALMAEDPALAAFAIEAIGLGERQPIAANTTADGADNPDGRALNRRVEIVVRTG